MLDSERLEILKALRLDQEWTLACDPSVPPRVRKILTGLQHGDDPEKIRCIKQLTDLCSKHGLVVVRTILENSYLLHSAWNLDQSFGPIAEFLEKQASSNLGAIKILAKEMRRFEEAPHNVTRNLAGFFKRSVTGLAGVDHETLRDNTLPFEMRLDAATAIVERREVEHYRDVIQFVLEVASEGARQAFITKTQRCAAILAKTQFEGLDIIGKDFNSGKQPTLAKHGPYFIGCFGPYFYRWFQDHLDKPDGPRPNTQWARVLLEAWGNGKLSLREREHLLEVLIDRWCSHPRVAELTKVKLLEKIRLSSGILDTCTEKSRDLIEDFLGKALGKDHKDIEQDIKNQFRDKSERLSDDRFYGRIAGRLVPKLSDDEAADFIGWIDHLKRRPRFLRGFFDEALTQNNFSAYSNGLQTRFLQMMSFSRSVTREVIERLLSIDNLDSEVRRHLNEVRTGLKPGAREDSTKGGTLA